MDLERVLSKYSQELLAIFSGIVIIFTIWFFIYQVTPLWSENRWLVVFSLVALIMGVIIPTSFYISEITLWPDPVGKLITGISIAIFIILINQVSISYGTTHIGEVLFTGLLGLSSSLLTVRGVLVPMFGIEYEKKEDTEMKAESHVEEKSDEEPDLFEEEDEVEEKRHEEDEKFLQEKDEPW